MEMRSVPEMFGENVFDDRNMRAVLSEDVYQSLRKTIDEGAKLDSGVADQVAAAMRDWALSKGATHFTHWFQPLTGITAEKHDSFIEPSPDGGVIMAFSGKNLIQGEPDASSFPTGGIRATFEARGYTAWDPTSYAFIKDKTLCIPTAFCSYTGEALDKKTPLLRSMEALNKQALRILRLFGNEDAKYVHTSVGPEQEYFLITKEMYDKRPDIKYTGRTLFGAKAPKGQEMDDHYFGVIKPKVQEFMNDLNQELWKLGILAKTEHNEVAPAQHELAPIYASTNIATDQNQLMMEIMQKVAARHGLVCLLHEKPFAGVNGSGKHNNWSMATDTGINLLSPGATPYENAQFLLFLCAVIKAVDDYQDLLRLSVATAGNDHRLGANEAPPAIISMYLGDDLDALVHSIIDGNSYESHGREKMQTGVEVLADFMKDNSDRNRTSPFAFTGNKFEFRALGSSLNIACPNYMLNTMVADELSQFYDELKDAENVQEAAKEVIRKTFTAHQRIIFNGDNYSDEWVAEAEKRGLLNLKSLPEALAHFLDKKNVDLFVKHNICSEDELRARYEIDLEAYSKQLNIEALTMLDMAKKDILPAVTAYIREQVDAALAKKALSSSISAAVEEKLAEKLSEKQLRFVELTEELAQVTAEAAKVDEPLEQAFAYRNNVFAKMEELRSVGDSIEEDMSGEYWPYPSYTELLFGV